MLLHRLDASRNSGSNGGMSALSVVGFASGSPQSEAAMKCIAREHRLLAIVVPRAHSGFRSFVRGLLRRAHSPFARFKAPLIDMADAATFRPDLIVVASFPQIIPAGILGGARIGALNMHMSLLPRHRGYDPLFWTYWYDDRDAGVTVHWMNERLDAGDIAAQQAMPLERGLASREAYMRLTALGVELLSAILGRVAGGESPRCPQDAARVTYESAADIDRARVPFAQWPAERVWHVLSGLGDQFSGLFEDAAGTRAAHGRARGYHCTGDVRPGQIDSTDTTYQLHCADGIVAVDRRR
jgi:methionyl-tRNA formyltransferase